MKYKSLSIELSEKINSKIKKGWGVGRILTFIRGLVICDRMTDLGILRVILYHMKKAGKILSREKIQYHLKTKVSKEDWAGSDKGEILRDLYSLGW